MILFNENIVDEILRDYLLKTTWLVKPSMRRVKYRIEKLLLSNNGFLAFLRIGNSIYYLPIICSEDEPASLLIERSYFIKYDKYFCVEAEYSKNYFDFMNNIGVSYNDYNTIEYNIVYSEPLTLDSPNAVGLHILSNNSKIVIKGYRLLSNTLLEPIIYEKLYNENFQYMPKLYRIYYYDLNNSRKNLSIVMEYIDGKNVLDIYSNYLENSLKHGSIKTSNYSDLSIMSIRIGHVIADLHLKLNSGESDNTFGLESISNSDISKWIGRISNRYQYVFREIKKRIDSSKAAERNVMEFFLKEMEIREKSIIDYVNYVFDKFYINNYKGRIHQDLVLNRFKYNEKTSELKIIDFEGEKLRSPDEVLSKEPLIRDLATIINDMYSIAMLTYNELYSNKSLLKNVVKIYKQKIPSIWVWTIRNTIRLIYGYSAVLSNSDLGKKLLSYGVFNEKNILLKTHYHVLLTPWIIDRALYETIRNIQSSSLNYIVSIAILLNPLFPILSIY